MLSSSILPFQNFFLQSDSLETPGSNTTLKGWWPRRSRAGHLSISPRFGARSLTQQVAPSTGYEIYISASSPTLLVFDFLEICKLLNHPYPGSISRIQLIQGRLIFDLAAIQRHAGFILLLSRTDLVADPCHHGLAFSNVARTIGLRSTFSVLFDIIESVRQMWKLNTTVPLETVLARSAETILQFQ